MSSLGCHSNQFLLKQCYPCRQQQPHVERLLCQVVRRLLCRTYHFISSDTSVCGPQYSFVIKKAFSCQTSGFSCRRWPAVYIGETGRTLRQPFGEHLGSIEKNLPGFPVAERLNTAGHPIDAALVRGMMLSVDNAQRKRVEMRLRFNLAPVSRAV